MADRIPQHRARAAMELATAILDMNDDLLPEDPGGDVEVTATTWAKWLEMAKAAAGDEVVHGE